MKTTQIMQRDLNGMSIRQNHKTGMFSANDLLEVYNKQNPNATRRIDKFLETATTKEYIRYIKERINEDSQGEADISNTPKTGYLDLLHKEAMNERKVVFSVRGRMKGGTWMHPYLFLDFAMWLSPEFKYECMKWLHDNLIKFRDEAGDTFKDVNLALDSKGKNRKIVYIQEANMINELVFGSAKKGQRNTATEEQLAMLQKLQKADIKLINKGFSFSKRKAALEFIKDL